MLLGGPSKAGKSFGLIELCIAIAEGTEWFGFKCAQGNVLYVNLELDRASCFHRFKDVYEALGLEPKNLNRIDIWNLRGKSVPMDKLAPMLIRRALKGNFIAVVIDPIYKVITGDENSADQMAHFCNQFDKVCTEIGCAVIYCHHHSKGAQGGKKSMDRVSGSGVFARDPDALLDLTRLEISEDLMKQQKDERTCKICKDWIGRFNKISEVCSQDDLVMSNSMIDIARKTLPEQSFKLMMSDVARAEKTVKGMSAWRIEGTLREFPAFDAFNLWFDHPIHKLDTTGVLKDCNFEGDFNIKGSPYKKNFSKKKSESERKQEQNNALETAFSGAEENGQANVADLAEYMGKSEKTVRRYIKEHGGFWIDGGEVGRKDTDKVE